MRIFRVVPEELLPFLARQNVLVRRPIDVVVDSVFADSVVIEPNKVLNRSAKNVFADNNVDFLRVEAVPEKRRRARVRALRVSPAIPHIDAKIPLENQIFDDGFRMSEPNFKRLLAIEHRVVANRQIPRNRFFRPLRRYRDVVNSRKSAKLDDAIFGAFPKFDAVPVPRSTSGAPFAVKVAAADPVEIAVPNDAAFRAVERNSVRRRVRKRDILNDNVVRVANTSIRSQRSLDALERDAGVLVAQDVKPFRRQVEPKVVRRLQFVERPTLEPGEFPFVGGRKEAFRRRFRFRVEKFERRGRRGCVSVLPTRQDEVPDVLDEPDRPPLDRASRSRDEVEPGAVRNRAAQKEGEPGVLGVDFRRNDQLVFAPFRAELESVASDVAVIRPRFPGHKEARNGRVDGERNGRTRSEAPSERQPGPRRETLRRPLQKRLFRPRLFAF